MLGDFERDRTLDYGGVRAEMVREGDRYVMRLIGEQGSNQRLAIVRTVGSRRIQQYLAKDAPRGSACRWRTISSSAGGCISTDRFSGRTAPTYTPPVAEWNSNCVFCHNVKAQPGFDWAHRTWKTEVAELGVACGACHGPAGDHAQAAISPLTRYRWHLGDGPARRRGEPRPAGFRPLGHDVRALPRPADSRAGRRIRDDASQGDPFDAGEDLVGVLSSRAARRQGRRTFSFRARASGPDGSPRLTAYEYQGLLRSKCFRAGKPGDRLTCTSCHSMHGGDPRGQFTEEMKTNAACNECHQKYATPGALAAHTRHPAASAGSLCYNCHMPKIVYGVMAAHRTHDISVPRPDDTVQFDKPNACNLCHVDKSVNRAIAETQAPLAGGLRAQRGGHALRRTRRPARLFAGDAVVRALTAAAMSPARDATAPRCSRPCATVIPSCVTSPRMRSPPCDPTLPKPDYLARGRGARRSLAAWAPRVAGVGSRAEARPPASASSAGRTEVDVEVGE